MYRSKKRSLCARILFIASLFTVYFLLSLVSNQGWLSWNSGNIGHESLHNYNIWRNRHILQSPEEEEKEKYAPTKLLNNKSKLVPTVAALEPEIAQTVEIKLDSNEITTTTTQSDVVVDVETTVVASRKEEEDKVRSTLPTSKKQVLATTTKSPNVVTNDSSSVVKHIKNNKSKEAIVCTPPAYHEFPPDLFTSSQRSHGAVILHALVVFYMFYALAVVCDDYFVASLEKCCEKLDISEDVAGATFMAIGSSAPELFTAILGVFVTKGDVGTGTIVGSAVFNILFVVGICAIFTDQAVPLNWWPLFRDSVFYSFTVIVLIIIIFDSTVTWVESLIMLLLYVVYILTMKFNSKIYNYVMTRTPLGGAAEDIQFTAQGILAHGDKKCYSSYVPFNNEIDQVSLNAFSANAADDNIRNSIRRWTLYEACLRMMITRHFRPLTRFRMAGLRVINEHQHMRMKKASNGGYKQQVSLEMDAFGTSSKRLKIESKVLDGWKQIPTREEGIAVIVRWVIDVPVFVALYYTVPDCSKEKWSKWFIMTFINSVLWIAVFSYIMVWMVTLIGYTLGVPDTIMGITFLAAGTSVPDAMASYIVARQGQGDMAVSNTIGSNIFDILIGLAFPWFLQTAMVKPGSYAHINSRGMIYSVILLFLTIIVTIGGVHYCRWQLTRRLGLLLLSVYFIFLVISMLTEFNVLGYVNPPMCRE